jgi:multidrug efflux system membrane fusion protein
LACLTGCSRGEVPGSAGALSAKGRGQGVAVPVIASVAQEKTVPLVLEAIGNARPSASVALKTRVDGQLASVQFKPGDEVKKGDIIFEIDPRPFQTALRQAEALQARDAASLTNALLELRRSEDLAATQIVSASLLDTSRATVESLRAQVDADKAAVRTATLQLSFCTIVAPVNGRVSLVYLDAGNMVKNNDTVLAVLNQTRPVYVDFAVPEQSLAAVRSAAATGPLRVMAAIPGNADTPDVGELQVVDNQVDATTGTVLLRGVFANEFERLWPGQFVSVTLTLGQVTNAVVVPAQAVQTSQEGEFVFVVKTDSTVEKRLVKLGPVRSGEAVIESGVKAGETIVTDGQLRLVPGAKADVKVPGSPSTTRPAGNAS